MKVPGLMVAGLLMGAAACGDDDEVDGSGISGLTVPDSYDFDSRFVSGASSVAYDGQVFRQVLVSEMVGAMERLTGAIDDGSRTPEAGDVANELGFYFDFEDGVGADQPLSLVTDPPLSQMVFADVSSGKDLAGKIAGNDPVGQHRGDWAGALVGFDEADTPEALVRSWFAELDALAVRRAALDPTLGPDMTPVSKVYVTADGRDLRQLIEKFLRGSVGYSQGVDDYLDNDVDGKGLLSDHVQDDDAPYSVLEHQWDEGFGYFGASRDYLSRTDDQVANRPFFDTDGDGAIDLQTEMSFGHSTNASKRDRGSVVSTDFSAQAMQGFLRGRAILAATAGEPLSEEAMMELVAARDQAVQAWEAAIAATAVHYINDTLQDMNAFGDEDAYSFEDHAKHWSELKGFAATLQFHPQAALSEAQQRELQDLIGTAPVLPNAEPSEIDAYRQDLLDARDLIGDAHGFDVDNLGDANGEGGW